MEDVFNRVSVIMPGQDNAYSRDRRRFKRRRLSHAVSFSPKNGRGQSAWYFGCIEDAGVAGMKISFNQSLLLHAGQKVMILCPVENGPPIWIGARVVWLDSPRKKFGVRYP